MASVFELKEQTAAETPLLLFECELGNGAVERWSTHQVECAGALYEARVVRHNLFEMETASEQGVDGIPRISLTLANADSRFSQLERTAGFKGARLTARFVFFDLKRNEPAAEAKVVFQGIMNPPDEITEATLRLTAVNRMGMQRVLLPAVRIQRRCPWEFPANAAQREEGMHGGARGRYSRFFRCGYSAGLENGTGNLNGDAPYTSCGYTRTHCEARGMFRTDAAGNQTRRFGGMEFVPASILVRSYGEKGWHAAAVAGSEARYNDFVPLVYGTAWYAPPVILARNDGNLTHMEVLLGMGEIEGVLKVLVNDVEIPQGQADTRMTATGWYNVASPGNRTGNFNSDFEQGDPYASMAYLSVVVPNRINDGRTLPSVKVLAQGLRLPVYSEDGGYLRDEFTANPAWVLLDILQRSGWTREEIEMASFAKAAAFCAEPVEILDVYGNIRTAARFECNLAVTKRRSAADLARGIRNTARLLLAYGGSGLLRLQVENTLALEQPVKPEWSNAAEPVNGGWPAYCFGDGTDGTSGILRRASGEPSIRVWSRSMADTPNRFSVEFQDAFNGYQQDSFSVVDAEDTARTGQEIAAALPALGIANYDQAARLLKFHLDKSIRGNTYVDFETSVKALGLRPGDLISVTYLKEGFERQLFRVLRIAPGMNFRTARITAQIHDDGWYSDTSGGEGTSGGREAGAGVGMPRPLSGRVADEDGEVQFEITEMARARTDGGSAVELKVGFAEPAAPDPDGPGAPLVSLAATIGQDGTLVGGRSLYYAVSAVDGEGRESGLSFTVHAAIPGGAGGYSVTLTGLSFAQGTAGMHVYRGANPAQLRRIATGVAISNQFTDAGMEDGTVPPPDANYDHANFYWRLEMQPEYAATIHSQTTVGNHDLAMEANEYRGMAARILSGKGAGQERSVIANDGTTLTLGSAWTVEPDATSRFAVAEAGWRFGATSRTSPVHFEIPNRTGAVMQISGRAANVNNLESPAELCTLTRWTVGGAGHSDVEVPPAPVFALGPARSQSGAVEVSSVSFPDLTNTRTAIAGTLNLYYWDELQGRSMHTVAAVDAGDSVLSLNAVGTARAGDYVQIGKEIVRVDEVLDGGLRYRVARGAHASTATAHPDGTAAYHLEKKTAIVPFVRDFFGSPSSGSWGHVVALPNARVASAEFFVTNTKGNSEISEGCLTYNADSGLRTMAGGQFSIQVDGYLAADMTPAPELIVDATRSVRDVFAVVRQAADAEIRMRIRQNGVEYCSLSIPAGATMSNVVDGFGMPPLTAGARVALEVLSVGQHYAGADLTVVIRL